MPVINITPKTIKIMPDNLLMMVIVLRVSFFRNLFARKILSRSAIKTTKRQEANNAIRSFTGVVTNAVAQVNQNAITPGFNTLIK